LACYVLFLVTYLYFIGFMGNAIVPTTLDGAPRVPLFWALLNNFALIGLFGVQHSVMARPAFKRAWTSVIPQHLERSTYVLFSCVALFALCWFWQPIGGTVWRAEDPALRYALYGVFAMGWLVVVLASLLINHFDLFGVRQVWLHFRGKPYTALAFRTPGAYRHIRHPLYVGWLMAFWATPDMTLAHLLMAAGLTAYILIAIPYEERDLEAHLGKPYVEYRNRTPLFVPRLRSLFGTTSGEKTKESKLA
jgi:protein-S-isoprenylcysteine O-methyltransferase Ste14